MSNQTHQTMQEMNTSELEVMGVLGADFLSLDELAPGQDWDDVLAASWGIPAATAEVAQPHRPSFVKHAMEFCWQTCFGWAFAA
ncbi:hypothetical protein IQ266_20330 [filamentous cyanobacterium LEGE 11480]|uniref:Uncharacterized protein n=1 Tax=Romeriopsis navalis LEGE 11480 TaxID=2777977 RepID=A0A928Z6C1_9CYAN|nr:hypothetical protein [Romeriopsis navalis]MBE9032090.1 hypothetical protein [Romeriopsis navalis LEGE 11480]